MVSLSIYRDDEETRLMAESLELGIARPRCRIRGTVRWGIDGTSHEARYCRLD